MKALLIVALLSFLMVALNSKQPQTEHTSALVVMDKPFFTIKKQGSDVVLNWATDAADEGRVEVEKSFNEQAFETVTVLKNEGAKARERRMYVDKTPFEKTAHEVKIIYYRLKFVEPNLIYTYSKTLSVVRETEDFPPVQ
jgi:hypothetical protein